MANDKDVKKYMPEIRDIRKWLGNVEEGQGFFPIVKLRNRGLIKKTKLSKGKMAGGVMVGEKSKYTLTSKGRQILNASRLLY